MPKLDFSNVGIVNLEDDTKIDFNCKFRRELGVKRS